MSKSTKRRRNVLLQGWLTPKEALIVQHKAAATGVSISELLRSAVLGYRLPRSKMDREIANQVMAAVQKARGEWKKIGSNINQIAKEVNMGRTPRLGSFESEWHELNDRVDRDFSEFRTLLMRASGDERNRKPPGKPDRTGPK